GGRGGENGKVNYSNNCLRSSNLDQPCCCGSIELRWSMECQRRHRFRRLRQKLSLRGPNLQWEGCSIKVTRVSILRGGLTRKEELASPSAVAARSRRAAADCLAILAEDA